MNLHKFVCNDPVRILCLFAGLAWQPLAAQQAENLKVFDSRIEWNGGQWMLGAPASTELVDRELALPRSVYTAAAGAERLQVIEAASDRGAEIIARWWRSAGGAD